MADTIKTLRKENDALKGQLKEIVKEVSTLKEKFDKQDLPSQPSTALAEQAKGLQYLSDEYDDLKLFKGTAQKELKCLNTKLTELTLKVDKISEQIDSIEQYSYNYNLKIVGVPQILEHETSEDTASLCIKLFSSIGTTNISLQDIDIAHRIPSQRSTGKPNAIICKFTRRLAKDKVLSRKRGTRTITPADLGLDPQTQIQHIGIFEHLTPRMQQLLYEAKRFQAEYNYKYCWSKSTSIFLRESDVSRIIKLRNMAELEYLHSQNDSITSTDRDNSER